MRRSFAIASASVGALGQDIRVNRLIAVQVLQSGPRHTPARLGSAAMIPEPRWRRESRNGAVWTEPSDAISGKYNRQSALPLLL